MKIHHVGYLSKNINKSLASFEELGYRAETEIVYDPLRDIDIVFLQNDGYRVELVSPKSKASPVYDTLKKLGDGPYHICYICDDIEEKMEELREKGYMPTGEIEPAVAIGGKRVCFMFRRQVGIIELLEDKEKENEE
ncbi:MAG: VOC family protein [Lachnospiraceae bacterium]|nr:VOC family protein [Lachnospiraceae bacterium]